jgi:bacillithiol synthase
LALHRLTVADGSGAGTRPVAQVPLPPDIDRVLDQLARTLPATEFRDETLATLRHAYRPGRGMAEAFGRLVDGLLGPLGIVVFDGSDAAAKRWAVPLFTRVLQHPAHTSQLAGAAGELLAALGYHAQVTPQSDTVALFYMRESREPIRHVDGTFQSGASTWTADELLGEVADHPERFSPNVLLRAVVQDTLFPTIAYVAGPSELAYLGQLREVYAFHGTPMPLIVPRSSGTLLDSAALRFLDKHGLQLQALRKQDEAVLNALLEAQLPPEVEQALGDADAALHDRLRALRDALPALDPTLVGAVDATASRVEHELRGLRTKVIHAAKRRHDTLRRQFTRAQHLAFPGGHPQERTVGLAWFMNRYGPGLVPRLYESLPLEAGRHWLLQI